MQLLTWAVPLELVGTGPKSVCFNSVGTDGAEWESTISKSVIDSANLEADSAKVMPALCFSQVLLVPEEESFPSIVSSQRLMPLTLQT